MTKLSNIVIVQPIPEKRWHGKMGKENFAQPKTYEVLYNKNTGAYDTGLTPEEADKYGKLLGVSLSDKFDHEGGNSYWATKPAWIPLPNHPITFNTEKPIDYVKVKNLKASDRVANNLKDYDEGKYPNATHYIVDEAEEVSNKAVKVAEYRKAIDFLNKMSTEDKMSMVQILSNKNLRGRGVDFVDVELDSILETPDNVDLFLRYARMGREEVALRATVLLGLAQNVLTKEGEAVYYMSEFIGMDIDAAVKWFKDPNNQKLKIAILDKIK
jgi:hypothetical protein